MEFNLHYKVSLCFKVAQSNWQLSSLASCQQTKTWTWSASKCLVLRWNDISNQRFLASDDSYKDNREHDFPGDPWVGDWYSYF